MMNMNVIGVSDIFNKENSKIQRCLWTIIIFTCLGLMIAQLYSRLILYLSVPVNVNVRVIHNESLRFPVVTLCERNYYNVSAALELLGVDTIPTNTTPSDFIEGNLLGKKVKDAYELWNLTKQDINTLITEVSCDLYPAERCILGSI